MSHYDQIPEDIRKQLADFQGKLNGIKVLPTNTQKEEAVKKAQKQFKRMKNLMETYRYAIDSASYEAGMETHKSQYKQFEVKLSKLETQMHNCKNDGGIELELFKGREKSNKNIDYNNRTELIQEGLRVQDDGTNILKGIVGNVAVMDQQANEIGLELDRQIQKLDSIYEDMNDTETTLKRAETKLKYFARQVYTDRLMICLIVLIAIAIIVIIALAIAGKIPKANTGTVK